MNFNNRDASESLRKERPKIETIQVRLIEKSFTVVQLMPNILINTMLYREERHNKVMSKVAEIISKLMSDQHQPIIKSKTAQKAWIAL